LLAVATCVLVSGCAGLSAPSTLRPALHPLLERDLRAAPLRPARPATAAPTVAPQVSDTDADPKLARSRRALIARAIDAQLGQRTVGGQKADDRGLVRAVFEPLRLDSAPERAGTATAAAARARPRKGSARIGDLVLFSRAGPTGAAERVAIVRRVHSDGGLDAAYVTRGAVRLIRVHPEQPGIRRAGTRILNTFIRRKTRNDPPGARYLAGQMLQGVRTLLD
jgi:hypothetical protein